MINSIFLFLNLSGSEILVIVLVAFIVFGPSKFPEISRKVGKFMRDAKSATRDITKEFESESNKVKSEINDVKREISSLADDVERKASAPDTKK